MRAFALAAMTGLAWLFAAAAGAQGLVFHFDRSDEEYDPVFREGPLVLSFSCDSTVNAAGRVQLLGLPGGPEATPWSGSGHLRLTQSAAGGMPVAVRAEFSKPIRSFELRAYQLDCYESGPRPRPSRCFNPLVIEVFSTDGALLGTLGTTRLVRNDPGGPPPDAGAYELLGFSSEQPIGWLRLDGDTNRSSFDELSVVLFDDPCGYGFELALVLPALLWPLRRGRRIAQRRRT